MLTHKSAIDIDDFNAAQTYPPPADEDGKRWPGNYRTWIENHDTLHQEDRVAIAEHIAKMPSRPLISVVMPSHNPPPHHLLGAVNSVRRQLYPHWELCIADDGSTDPEVVSLLCRLGNRDPRIRVTFRADAGHIARASNDALALATGEFVALLDHDDLLTEHALYMVAQAIAAQPDVGILYSDEDKVDEHRARYGPYFKQHFNRDNLLGQNCINHLGVFKRALMLDVGGFAPGTEGAQDYDITLRILERIEDRQVRHIPHILYHWRAALGSTALDPEAKTYAFEAGRCAIAAHLERQGVAADVRHGSQLGVYRVKYPTTRPSVSLIVMGMQPHTSSAAGDVAWLQSLIRSASTRASEVLFSADSRTLAAMTDACAAAGGPAVRGVATDAPSWAGAANDLVASASGEVLVFLAAGLWPTGGNAFAELIAQAQRTALGAVGARLQRPDNAIMHDGYVMGLGGLCGSFHANWAADTSGYFGLGQIARSCAAVSGHAMAMRRDTFTAMQGFDTQFTSVRADVDMCLRLRQRGLNVVYTPFAAFITPPRVHNEPQNPQDAVRLLMRHRSIARVDPYWNPNLRLQPGMFELTDARPGGRPWLAAARAAG